LLTPLRSLSEISGPAAWLSVVTHLLISAVYFLLFYKALSLDKDKNLLDISEQVLGKYAGKALNVLIVIFLSTRRVLWPEIFPSF